MSVTNEIYLLTPTEAESQGVEDSASALLKRIESIEATLEEIKGLLLQIIEPSLYKEIRISEIARKFAQGDKTALKQWNREQKYRAEKC